VGMSPRRGLAGSRVLLLCVSVSILCSSTVFAQPKSDHYKTLDVARNVCHSIPHLSCADGGQRGLEGSRVLCVGETAALGIAAGGAFCAEGSNPMLASFNRQTLRQEGEEDLLN